MKRILVIGCPGSGKSTLSKQMANKLNYPLLHLDRIYHIDNFNQIPRQELIDKILDFINANDRFIIDGNYSATLELRMQHADTIIFFDIDKEICLQNVVNRITSGEPRDDIAPGFDNSIIDPEFIKYVKEFKEFKQPYVEELLKHFKGKIIRLNDYIEKEEFLEDLDSL